MVRSLVINPHEDMRTWLKYASLCGKSGRLVSTDILIVELLMNTCITQNVSINNKKNLFVLGLADSCLPVRK